MAESTPVPKASEIPGARVTFSSLPDMTRYATFVMLAFVGFIIYDQLYWWRIDEEYSFGYLVPFFVGFVIYDRWARIKTVFDTGHLHRTDPDDSSKWLKVEKGLLGRVPEWGQKLVSFIFICALILGVVSFAFGALLRALQAPQNPASLSISWGAAWVMLSLVYFFSDETVHGTRIAWAERMRTVGVFIFPAFIWIMSAPLLSVVENRISLFLLARVTEIVFGIFDFLGFAMVREGNILVLPKGQVGVEDACSGIRSMTACLFAGSFLGAVFLRSFLKKCLLIIAALCLAFFTNILRSLFLTGWAYAYGSDAIEGLVHDVAGYAVLGLTCIGLLILLPIFELRLEWSDDEQDDMDGTNPAS